MKWNKAKGLAPMEFLRNPERPETIPFILHL